MDDNLEPGAQTGAEGRSENGANSPTVTDELFASLQSDAKEEPNPWLLKSEGAKRAYKLTLEFSTGKGILTNKAGERCGKKAPDSCMIHNPEQLYDKPEGFAIISRNFPCNNNDSNKISLACAREMDAMGISQKEQAAYLQDFIALNRELKATFALKLRSKLRLDVNANIRSQEIKAPTPGSQTCTEMNDVNKLFRTEIPTDGFFRKVYNAYLRPFESGELIDKRSYETMIEMKVWFGTGPTYDKISLTGKMNKLKTSQVRAIARDKMRDFRKPFTEKTEHGVTLNITQKGGRGKNRRKTMNFTKDLIKGWNSDAHIIFVKDRTGKDVVPLDDQNSKPAATQKPGTPKPGKGRVRIVSGKPAHKLAPAQSSSHPTGKNNGSGVHPALGRQTFQTQWLSKTDRGSNQLPPVVEDNPGKVVIGPATKANGRLQVARAAVSKQASTVAIIVPNSNTPVGLSPSSELRKLSNSPGWNRASRHAKEQEQPVETPSKEVQKPRNSPRHAQEQEQPAETPSKEVQKLQNSPGWNAAGRHAAPSGTTPRKANTPSKSPKCRTPKVNSPTAHAAFGLMEKRLLEAQEKQRQAELDKKEAERKHMAERKAMLKKIEEQGAAANVAATNVVHMEAMEVAKANKKLEKKSKTSRKSSKKKKANKAAEPDNEDPVEPHTDDPDDIVQFHETAIDRNTEEVYWIFGTEKRGKNLTDVWFGAEYAHEYCEACVRGGEPQNFLLQFCLDNPELVTVEFAQAVAKWREVPYADLFETCLHKFRKDEDPEEEEEPKGPPSEPSTPSPVKPRECTHDHDVAGNYIEIENNFYFLENRRFSNCSCRTCNKYFATDRNKKEKDYAERGNVLFPKQAKAYGCEEFVQGRHETCGCLLCNGCYINLLESSGRSGRKRSHGIRNASAPAKKHR